MPKIFYLWFLIISFTWGAIPLAGVDLWVCFGTKIWECTSFNKVSILLLFIKTSFLFLTTKWIWTEMLPKPLTPLHSKTPESAKVTPLIFKVFLFGRNRSHIEISWSSWYHSMMGFGFPIIGQFNLTVSSSSATYFSV